LASELTQGAIFDALRHCRNYAVTNARIVLSFKIDGHEIGEEIEATGWPKIDINIRGTDTLSEVAILRNGAVLHLLSPVTKQVKFRHGSRRGFFW
jgi:hypothetical protein